MALWLVQVEELEGDLTEAAEVSDAEHEEVEAELRQELETAREAQAYLAQEVKAAKVCDVEVDEHCMRWVTEVVGRQPRFMPAQLVSSTLRGLAPPMAPRQPPLPCFCCCTRTQGGVCSSWAHLRWCSSHTAQLPWVLPSPAGAGSRDERSACCPE